MVTAVEYACNFLLSQGADRETGGIRALRAEKQERAPGMPGDVCQAGRLGQRA